jgi:hypothetical protein
VYADAIARAHRLATPLAELVPVRSSQWIQNGYFDTFEWLLRHGYHQGLFDNETYFKMIDYVDQWYATKYESLGWEDENIRDSCWPKTSYTIRRLREVMELFIDVYDARFVCSIPWFPAWAVRNGKFQSLRRLADMDHPQLRTAKFARYLLHKSRDEAMVQWFIEKYPSQFTTHVVRWAVEHDKPRLLVWVFETFLPTKDRGGLKKLQLWNRCLRTAVWSAAKHNRHEVIHLLSAWTTDPDTSWLWRGISTSRFPRVGADVDMSDD